MSKLLFLLSVLYAASILFFFPTWTVDDAFITYRYADNFANHGQLTWNIGENPEEGYTGIALPFILGIFIKLGFSPVIVSPIIGIVSYFAAGFFIYLILKQFNVEPLTHGAALLFYATLPFLFTNALSGLETTLFLALVTASFLALVRCCHSESTSPTNDIIFGITLLMTSLTRPEGVALTIGCLCALIYVRYIKNEKRQIPWRALLIFALTYAVPALIYFIWRTSYYEQLLPNTFYVKTIGGFQLNHIKDLVHFLVKFFSAPIICVFIVLLINPDQTFKKLSEKNLSKPLKALLISSFIFVGMMALQFTRSRLAMNFSYRFFIPFLPPLIVVLFVLLGTSIPSLKATRSENPLKFKLIVVALAILSLYQLLTASYRLKDELKYATNTNISFDNLSLPVIESIRAIVPPNEWLSSLYDVGAISYYTGLKTIDFGGFNDKKIAKKIVNTPEQFINYFFSFHPGVAIITSYNATRILHDRKVESLVADPRFQEYILLKQFGLNHVSSNQNYYQNVFIRKDLISTTTTK